VAVTKEIKRLEKSNVSLSIIVPKEDVRSHYDKMIGEYVKDLQIPGFRKGKVPQEVLERKFGEALKDDALSRILESSLHEIFMDENLPRSEKPLPYAVPELQGKPVIDFDNELQFTVIYDVLPDIKIGQWKGLKIDYSYAEVEEKDINRELEEIRDRNSSVLDRDDNAAVKKGDVVTIDYQFYEENGEILSDMQRKDFVFTAGSGTNVYKFDDDIIGMKKGETKEFVKKFEKEHFSETLAGKSIKIQVTLTALKEKILPDLDDDFAQDVDLKFKTLDDLKNSIKEKLSKNLELRLREKKLDALLKKIMENTTVILPESMIKAEVDGRWRRLARYYNMDPERVAQMMSETGKDKEWREEAEKALHSRLIIETLMEEQKIEASDDDLEKEFSSIAAANGAEINEIKGQYNEEAVYYLKEDIKEKKMTDMMLAENNLKQGKKENYLDFMTDNG
jgi:trigger factor